MSTATTTNSISSISVLWEAGLDDAPVAVAVSSQLVAVAGAGGRCQVSEADDGRPVAAFDLEGGLLDLAFSSDGTHLALTGPTANALWRTDGRYDVRQTGEWSSRARWIGSDRVAIAEGRHVVVCSNERAELWRTGEAPSTVTDLVWLRQGRELAVSAYNGVYQYAPHQREPTRHYPYSGSHLAIAAAPNGRWICTGNQDRSVHIWRTRDGDELEMSGYPDKVNRVGFDDTSRWFANNGAPEITVWDFAGKGPSGRAPRLLANDANAVFAWRPGNNGILATLCAEGILALWQVETGRPGKPMRPFATAELDSPGTAIAWLDPHHLVTADHSGAIRRHRLT